MQSTPFPDDRPEFFHHQFAFAKANPFSGKGGKHKGSQGKGGKVAAGWHQCPAAVSIDVALFVLPAHVELATAVEEFSQAEVHICQGLVKPIGH